MDNKFDLKKFITENKNEESVDSDNFDKHLEKAKFYLWELGLFLKDKGNESYLYYNSFKELEKIQAALEQLKQNVDDRENAWYNKAGEYDPDFKKDFGATPEFDKLFADMKDKYRMDEVD